MIIFFFWSVCLPICAGSNGWDLVRELIDEQPIWEDVIVTVGRSEREFIHVKGNMTTDQKLEIASASKMLSSTVIFKLIENGKVSLEDLVSKYIPYWSRNESDSRSRVKIKHVLSFTSGYTFGLSKLDVCLPNNLTFAQCFKQLYEKFPHSAEPGTTWDYNEFHLQIMGAVLESVTGLSIDIIMGQHLKNLGMLNSSYLEPKNPDLSGNVVSTSNDYERFIIQYFNDKIIGQKLRLEVEEDWTPYPLVNTTLASSLIQVFMGHYGLTNFYECPFLVARGWPDFPPECLENDVHSDPGLFGWLPLYDRKIGYWMQIAAFKPLGAIRSAALRYLLKPFVDAAIKGKEINVSRQHDYSNLLTQVHDLIQNRSFVSAIQKMAPITWEKKTDNL